MTGGGKPMRVAVPVEVPDAVAAIAAGSTASSGYGASGYGIGGGGGSAGVPRAAVATVLVAIGAPMSTGSLDKRIIRRYVHRRLHPIQYCYEKRLMSRPNLAGTVTTHFTIGGNGRVVAATADGLGDAELEACITGVIQAIEFPGLGGGSAIQVNYPFEFHPAREPSR